LGKQPLKLNPNDADAYFDRGFAYRAKGNKQKAIADFQASLKRQTACPTAACRTGREVT